MQNDHSWSKHRVSHPLVSTPSKKGDNQYCKMFVDGLCAVQHFMF
jgi:hypothetical protein